MDRTLLFLLVVTGLLVAILAPHATLILTTIVALSVLATRLVWALFQSFEETSKTRGAID